MAYLFNSEHFTLCTCCLQNFQKWQFWSYLNKHKIYLLFTFQLDWFLNPKGKLNLLKLFFLTNPGSYLASNNYRRSVYYLLTSWKITFSKDSTFTPTRMAIITGKKKRKKITSVGKDVKKLEPLCTARGNVKWCSYCEKRFGSYSKS